MGLTGGEGVYAVCVALVQRYTELVSVGCWTHIDARECGLALSEIGKSVAGTGLLCLLGHKDTVVWGATAACFVCHNVIEAEGEGDLRQPRSLPPAVSGTNIRRRPGRISGMHGRRPPRHASHSRASSVHSSKPRTPR